jgi:exodeoxyribonuclease VII large subunit
MVDEQTSVYTVSQLTAQIKKLLESGFRFLWVRGEISNYRVPASGHAYFTLKDDQSQIRAVLFRTQQRSLRFVPEDGLQVLCQGRLSVFEARGEYQLIVDVMEPRGVGALQLAFEQLKKKLAGEGLFDPAGKQPLPPCPQRVGIVTSATGAAIRDILKVFQRSPLPLAVTLLPVRVQGEGAAREIAAALDTANGLAATFSWDVLIIGRGGGSLEDLWPFNEEIVARAVARSRIPVISAVGHEIDLTISDLVADMRAPTPTAAAEWIVAQLERVAQRLLGLRERLAGVLRRQLDARRQYVHFLSRRVIDPRRRLGDLRLLLDDRLTRLQLACDRYVERLRTLHGRLQGQLAFHNPQAAVGRYRELVSRLLKELLLHQRRVMERYRGELLSAARRLDSLSPLAVLARGYSITYRLPDAGIVRHPDQVAVGGKVRVRLAKGMLTCVVEGKHADQPPSQQEG